MGTRQQTAPLGRALSKLGAASRAQAKILIAEGRVRVDGRVVINPLQRVPVDSSRIVIDGHAVPSQEFRLIAFHKPRGVVTTRHDPEGRRTVFDVLGDEGKGLVVVGRLDRASTGLLLLTTDTALANQLTDPASGLVRKYVVTVRGRVDPDAARQLEAGIDVPGERARRDHLAAKRVTIRKASGRETHLIVELTEGKNREIRRLFDAIGHQVTRLHRIAFGPYELGDLAPGSFKGFPFHASATIARLRATSDTADRRRARNGVSGLAVRSARARDK